MKKILFVFMLILLATIQPASTQAAEGDPIWTKTSNPSVGTDYAHALVVDSTGLYVAGIDATPPVAGDVQWRIEKRSLVNGDPIWTKTIDPSGGWDRISALAVDSTGLYAAGWDSAPSIGDFQWRIEKRSLVNGDPIWTKTVNPSASWDTAFALAVDGTGLYAAGMDSNPGNFQWRIEKRSLVNGDPIWTKTVNPYNIATGFTFETVYALAVDGTGLYAAGMDLAPGNNQWRIEKRSLVNGDPIWAKTSNPSSSHDGAYALAVDATGPDVAGAYAVPGNNQWR
ncbi:MAG: hypothetical protein KBD19_04830, partial [Candidatus Moranbacteria bacterium]|nr:hypothetical protein [Candidatus Moranbacteria bacterium]